MQIKVYPIIDVVNNVSLYKELKKMTFSATSGMGSFLRNAIKASIDNDLDYIQNDKAIIAFDKDEAIGWAMLEYIFTHNEFDFGVFVKPKYRRQGIGSKLLKRARAIARHTKAAVNINLHDKTSAEFFKKHGADESEPGSSDWQQLETLKKFVNAVLNEFSMIDNMFVDDHDAFSPNLADREEIEREEYSECGPEELAPHLEEEPLEDQDLGPVAPGDNGPYVVLDPYAHDSSVLPRKYF